MKDPQEILASYAQNLNDMFARHDRKEISDIEYFDEYDAIDKQAIADIKAWAESCVPKQREFGSFDSQDVIDQIMSENRIIDQTLKNIKEDK